MADLSAESSLAAQIEQLRAEVAEQRCLNESYAQQVSLDFEELTCLRSLADYIEICDVTNELRGVLEIVLPRLRQIVAAEALVFLPAVENEDSENDGDKQIGEPSFWSGREILDGETCRRLVERFRHSLSRQPVVKNNMHRCQRFRMFPGLKSCIILQISKKGYLAGWLVAMNRLDSQQSTASIDAADGDVWWGNEFGTFEAGLLGAASVMFATHARNIHLFREQEKLLVGVIRALVSAMDAKDSYTCGHSDRVALMARRLGEELELDEQQCERLYMTGLLHDVGKIGVPDQVLQKTGKLTPEEFDLIKQHPVIGYRILKHLKQFKYVLPGVLHHHEAVDGSGYPHGLEGEDIALSARILAVADSYDAMTSSRPYRDAMPHETAQTILKDGAGSQWDAEVVKAFLRAVSDMQRVCAASYEHTRSILQADDDTPSGDDVSQRTDDSITSAVSATHK